MSLRLWLPLNNNSNTQGLDNATISTIGSVTYTGTGKIHLNSAYFGAGNLQFSITNQNAPREMSVCFWLKPNTPPAWNDIISFGINNNRLEKANVAGQYRWYIADTTKPYLLANGTVCFTGVTDKEWSHITMTIDRTNVKCYVNGVLQRTLTQSAQLENIFSASSNLFTLGCGGGNDTTSGYYTRKFTSWVNDFRMYDHCLSAKEVKEISQGLICHYKMDELGGRSGNPNMKEWTNWATTNAPSATQGKFSRSIVEDADAKNGQHIEIKCTTAVTDANKGFYLSGIGKADDRIGKTFTWSMYIKSSVAKTIKIGDETGGQINSQPLTTSWQKITKTWTMTNSTDTAFVFYSANGYAVNDTIYIRDFKFEEGSVATEWCPNVSDTMYSYLGFNDSTIYDCSGFLNDGTNVNITSLGEGNKYNKSLVFFKGANNASSTLIKVPRTCKVTDQISVACWAYKDNWTADDWRLFSCTESGGWNVQHATDGGTSCYATCYADGSDRQSHSFTLTSGWHHFVFTWDGYKTNLFVDGVELGNESTPLTTKTPITYHASNGICLGCEAGGGTSSAGSHFIGRINDFRIYATALSADDVKTLYDVRTAIDKTANIYSGELIEQDGVSGFEKNFIAHSQTFTEFQCLTNDMMNWTNNNIESDGKITTYNNKLSEPICVRGFQYLKIDNLATTTHYIIVASCREDGSIIAKDGIGKVSIANGASSGVVTIGNYEYIRILQWDKPSSPIPFNLYLYSGTQNVANIGKVKSSIDGQSFYEN